MPEAIDPPVAQRKAELFAHLKAAHDQLTEYQDKHAKTGYGCVRSGHCCQVGLQLHYMECEHIANHLKRTYAHDPDGLEAVIERLEHAFTDEEWVWSSSIGGHHCAFFEDGCTIYPFRPSICRMYGVVLETDEWCPREKLSNGKSFVYVQKDVDQMVAHYYRTLDAYGRMFPKLDHTVYMPAGVLYFLLAPKRYEKLKATTPKKFWKREKGYRTQFQPSYRRGESLQTNVRVKWMIPAAKR